jgi:hypothetical protein
MLALVVNSLRCVLLRLDSCKQATPDCSISNCSDKRCAVVTVVLNEGTSLALGKQLPSTGCGVRCWKLTCVMMLLRP